MYAKPAFEMDRATCLAFAAARGFGLVVAADVRRPVGSALPFCLDYARDGGPRLAFHVARENPLAVFAAAGGTWLVVVQGADAYVSPDWYASPCQVPTWLYESVQLSGAVRVLPRAETAAHLDHLSAAFERRLAPKSPWTAASVPPARREAMLDAIVGIEMAVDTVEGSAKLNQHKSDADQLGVVAALRRAADAMSTRIAARMVALRPQLDYE